MKIRGLVYIALLIVCIVVKLLIWLPISSHFFVVGLSYGEWLSDLVFFGVLAIVLGTSKERTWIVGIAWATAIVSMAEAIQVLLRHRFFDSNPFPFLPDLKLLTFFKILLYIALLFARQGPLRVLIRWLAVIPVIPLLVPHLSYPRHHVPPLAIAVVGACITLLQYILLIDMIRKTPELESAQGIDFP